MDGKKRWEELSCLSVGYSYEIIVGLSLIILTSVMIDMGNLQRFKLYEPQQPAAPNPIVNGELVPTSNRKIDYNMIGMEFCFLSLCPDDSLYPMHRFHDF